MLHLEHVHFSIKTTILFQITKIAYMLKMKMLSIRSNNDTQVTIKKKLWNNLNLIMKSIQCDAFFQKTEADEQ